jgi:hypothetical protein
VRGDPAFDAHVHQRGRTCISGGGRASAGADVHQRTRRRGLIGHNLVMLGLARYETAWFIDGCGVWRVPNTYAYRHGRRR